MEVGVVGIAVEGIADGRMLGTAVGFLVGEADGGSVGAGVGGSVAAIVRSITNVAVQDPLEKHPCHKDNVWH